MDNIQEYTVGIDPGTVNMGVAVVNTYDNALVFQQTIHLSDHKVQWSEKHLKHSIANLNKVVAHLLAYFHTDHKRIVAVGIEVQNTRPDRPLTLVEGIMCGIWSAFKIPVYNLFPGTWKKICNVPCHKDHKLNKLESMEKATSEGYIVEDDHVADALWMALCVKHFYQYYKNLKS